jgi:hypothetical protein
LEGILLGEKEVQAVNVDDEMEDGDEMNPCVVDARRAGAANLRARCIFLFSDPRIRLLTYLSCCWEGFGCAFNLSFRIFYHVSVRCFEKVIDDVLS